MTWADFQQFDHTGAVMLNDLALLKNPDRKKGFHTGYNSSIRRAK